MTHSGDFQSPAARAAEALLAGNAAASLRAQFEAALQEEAPDVAQLSIALGAVEAPLTVKQEHLQRWPEDLAQQVAACAAAFDGFVLQMDERLRTTPWLDARAKVKLVADAVWSKLSAGSFSKDILHAQHVYSFAATLLPGGSKGKRQLDCAGVVTTVYAACQRLARSHDHAVLAGLGMAISEDHCWLQLGPGPGPREGGAGAQPSRELSVEVTTDTPAKRGLPATEEAWAGWLYNGGRAVLCCRHRTLAALANSLNPAVTGGKKGQDSEQLQALQYCLLSALWRERPAAMYPAALCSLGDLEEVGQQDELDAALEEGQQARVDALLQRRSGDAQQLFEQAIAMTAAWGTQEAQAGPSAAEASGNGTVDVDIAGAGTACSPEEGGVTAVQASPAAPVDAVATAPGESAAPADAVPPSASAEAAVVEARNGACVGEPAAGGQPEQHQQPQEQQQQQQQSEGLAPWPTPALQPPADPGWQWYPYSFLGGYLARRAEFLAKCAAAFPADAERYAALALGALRGALAWFAAGAGVLARYRFTPTDDQLYKDIEGALEYIQDGLIAAAAAAAAGGGAGANGSGGGVLNDPTLLQPALRLWDGVCQLYAGRAKPSGWVALLLKVAKLFTPTAREAAAAAEAPASEPMRKAQPLWGPLKPVALRPVLELADVGAGEARAIKRPRR